MSKIKDIGESIIDVIDNTIDSVGQNIKTSANENEAKVAILDATADKIRTEAQIKKEQNQQVMQIAKYLVFALILILLVITVSKYVLPTLKK